MQEKTLLFLSFHCSRDLQNSLLNDRVCTLYPLSFLCRLRSCNACRYSTFFLFTGETSPSNPAQAIAYPGPSFPISLILTRIWLIPCAGEIQMTPLRKRALLGETLVSTVVDISMGIAYGRTEIEYTFAACKFKISGNIYGCLVRLTSSFYLSLFICSRKLRKNVSLVITPSVLVTKGTCTRSGV